MEKIKNFASGLKSKFMKSDVEKLLSLALNSSDPPSMKIYSDLAEKSLCQEDARIILKVLLEGLVGNNKDINRIIKSLLLCEALCSLSSSSFINDLKACIVKLKVLVDYSPEDKPLELTGIVRDSSRKLINLLTNEEALQKEREKSAIERQAMNESKTGQTSQASVIEKEDDYRPPSNWYETAKVQVAEPSSYPCPDLSNIEKMQFVRNVPEAKPPNIFNGLRTREDKNPEKSACSEQHPGKNDIFLINKPLNSLNQPGNLFGVPMKAKFLKTEDSKLREEPLKDEKPLNNDSLFNGLQKKQATVEANGNSNQLNPINNFDLLNLKLNFEECSKNIQAVPEKLSQKAEKSENSNSFLQINLAKVKIDQGQASFGYNHALFDAEFPVISKEPAKVVKPDVKNLEKTLINLDELDFSLSKTKAPRRLMN